MKILIKIDREEKKKKIKKTITKEIKISFCWITCLKVLRVLSKIIKCPAYVEKFCGRDLLWIRELAKRVLFT